MSFYQPSSHYKKLIKERYGREPIQYPQQGRMEYEDDEYVRSLAYENGEMNYLGPTTKEAHALMLKKVFAPTNPDIARMKRAMEKLENESKKGD